MTVKFLMPAGPKMIEAAQALLISHPDNDSWPLDEAWQGGGLRLYVFPEEERPTVKTQVSIASFESSGRRYVVVVGSD